MCSVTPATPPGHGVYEEHATLDRRGEGCTATNEIVLNH